MCLVNYWTTQKDFIIVMKWIVSLVSVLIQRLLIVSPKLMLCAKFPLWLFHSKVKTVRLNDKKSFKKGKNGSKFWQICSISVALVVGNEYFFELKISTKLWKTEQKQSSDKKKVLNLLICIYSFACFPILTQFHSIWKDREKCNLSCFQLNMQNPIKFVRFCLHLQ